MGKNGKENGNYYLGLRVLGMGQVYSPPYADRILGVCGSCYNIPKAIFYLLRGDYNAQVQSCHHHQPTGRKALLSTTPSTDPSPDKFKASKFQSSRARADYRPISASTPEQFQKPCGHILSKRMPGALNRPDPTQRPWSSPKES